MCVYVCVWVREGAAPGESEADRGSEGERGGAGGGGESWSCLLKTAGARSSEKCQVKLFLTVLISAPHSHNYM